MLLELLIALFLVGTYALPLMHLPLAASQEQMNCLYRFQSQHLADEGLAKLKEKLYKNEVAWSDIVKTTKGPFVVFEDFPAIAFPSLNGKFKRTASLKFVRKKVKGTEEWWLVMARIELAPEGKRPVFFKTKLKKKRVFAHYLILHKSSAPAVVTS